MQLASEQGQVAYVPRYSRWVVDVLRPPLRRSFRKEGKALAFCAELGYGTAKKGPESATYHIVVAPQPEPPAEPPAEPRLSRRRSSLTRRRSKSAKSPSTTHAASPSGALPPLSP